MVRLIRSRSIIRESLRLNGPRQRIILAAFLFISPFLLTAEPAAQIITSEPTEGVAGASVTVSGTGWPVGDLVDIAWNFNYQLKASSVRADNSGKFGTTIAVPQGATVGPTYIDAANQDASISAQSPFCVGQKPVQFEIVCYTTFSEGSLVYFRLFFTDPDPANKAEGFGFQGVNGFGWAKETLPFSSPSYGRVFPGRIEYPFNELCGTASAYESDVEAWIYNKAGPSEHVTVHLACSSDLRNEVLNRARSWIKAKVKYNTGVTKDGYRTDCSGFVSYAWQIKDSSGQPYAPVTSALASTYTTKLSSFADLKPGDVINNDLLNEDGHVVMFVNWTDQSHTTFLAYDENADTGATRYILMIGNGITLWEGQGKYQLNAPGPFYAERYNCQDKTDKTLQAICVQALE